MEISIEKWGWPNVEQTNDTKKYTFSLLEVLGQKCTPKIIYFLDKRGYIPWPNKCIILILKVLIWGRPNFTDQLSLGLHQSYNRESTMN